MMRSRAVVITALALGLACAHAWPVHPDAGEPLVERVADDRLQIRWDGVPEAATVEVYEGSSPDAIDRSRPIGKLTSRGLELSDPDRRRRRYFELALPGGERRVVAERLLPLEGAHNFRDLGGYETSDGRRVRWGVLYRSDDLGDLTPQDRAALAALPLRRVYDFRSQDELAADPDRLPADPAPETVHIPVADEHLDPARIERMIRTRSLAGVDFAAILEEGNRAFAARHTLEFASFLQLVSEAKAQPSVFHCTAGKDRTGFAAALVLLALGVPRETVMSDYLLTNLYTASSIERTLMWIRAYLFFRTPADAIRPLLAVRRDYLEAAFDEIESRYGSFDAYLRDGLGVTDEELAKLRAALLR
jgi:protein-tyrosine phosphatase